MTQSTQKQQKASSDKSQSHSVICFLARSNSPRDIPTYWIKFDPDIVDEKALQARLERILVDANFETSMVSLNQKRQDWAKKWKNEGFDYWAEKTIFSRCHR